MALTLKTQKETDNIVKNLIKASTIELKVLSVSAYKFINIASGFIAHYDIFGYIGNYETAVNLGNAILHNQRNNQHSNFSSIDENYEYMMQEKDIYNRVCDGINEYRQLDIFKTHEEKDYKIIIKFKAKTQESALGYAASIRNRCMEISRSTITVIEIKPG